MAEGGAGSRGTPVARLTLLDAEGEPQQWPIAEGSLTIGRGKDCHLSIPDTRLSRRHSELLCQGREVTVTDLGSVNGTFVNNQRVHVARPLHDGDRLRVGPFEFAFEILAPPQAEIPERPTVVMEEPSSLPRLEVSSGPQCGHAFDLTRARTVIGRAGPGQPCDILLQDRAVSRPHAEVLREPDGFLLKDLGSANGTLVNGVLLTEAHHLADGDAITFGEAVLIFRAGAA